jgi:hypothetical protein
MKLTWLAEEFRRAGLRVVEEPGWEDRGKSWVKGRPIGALQHHTAAPVPYPVRSLYLPVRIKCNFNVKADGTIHVIAAGSCNYSTGEGSAAVRKETSKGVAPSGTAKARGLPNDAGGNAWYLTNETDHLGDGGPIPKAQYEAVLGCWIVIFDRMGWTAERLIGHGEWTDRKTDPRWNDKNSHHNLEDLRADLRSALGGETTRLSTTMTVMTAMTAPATEEDDDTMLPLHFHDGFSEPTGKGRTRKRDDVKLLQALLGMSDDDIDGKYGDEVAGRVKAICGGDGKVVDGQCYIKIQESYLMSFLRDTGNGLTEDEANAIYSRKNHSH